MGTSLRKIVHTIPVSPQYTEPFTTTSHSASRILTVHIYRLDPVACSVEHLPREFTPTIVEHSQLHLRTLRI